MARAPAPGRAVSPGSGGVPSGSGGAGEPEGAMASQARSAAALCALEEHVCDLLLERRKCAHRGSKVNTQTAEEVLHLDQLVFEALLNCLALPCVRRVELDVTHRLLEYVVRNQTVYSNVVSVELKALLFKVRAKVQQSDSALRERSPGGSSLSKRGRSPGGSSELSLPSALLSVDGLSAGALFSVGGGDEGGEAVAGASARLALYTGVSPGSVVTPGSGLAGAPGPAPEAALYDVARPSKRARR
jgi:hypothetical protein